MKILTSDLSLTHYDPKKDIVACDAKNLGLGAVIMHTQKKATAK